VRSSTSSSDIYLTHRPIAAGNWLRAVCIAVAGLLVVVALMEARLASRGFHTTVLDTDLLWLKQRQRAIDLGDKALIIVGASRVQLDLDLDVLRHDMKLEPVQLAVDGSSFIPVLRDLAQDDRVAGTILVEYEDVQVESAETDDRGKQLVKAWERMPPRRLFPDYAFTEGLLSEFLHEHLRSYADGARPLTSLLRRILDSKATPQYLVTLASRERLADYQKVPMPSFYYNRVARNLGEVVSVKDGMTWDDLDADLSQRIAALQPAPRKIFDANTVLIAEMVRKIEARGSRIYFLAMPTSGLIREMDARRYPRDDYWNSFSGKVGAIEVNAADYADLRVFQCPDGSHLDFRDRARFTTALAGVLAHENGVPRR
jgi:hypothetical protein